MQTRRLLPAALLAAALAAGCGRDAPVAPRPGGLGIRVRTAPQSPAAPAVGPVDSMRVYLRGPAGELLIHPALLRIEPGQARFQVALEAVPGQDRSITVMAIGDRPVSGLDDVVTGRGILFAGRVEGLDIVAGRIPTIDIDLSLFVPDFLPPQTTRGSALHTMRWVAIPTADAYQVTVATPRGTETVVVRENRYDGTVLPATYQVRAVEYSGFLSAPSDFLLVTGQTPNAPQLSVAGTGPGRIDLSWSNVGDGLDGYELQRSESLIVNYQPLVTLAGFTTSYSDLTAMPEVDYVYRVRALSPAGPSDWSNPVNAVAPFPAAATPVNVTARSTSPSSIRIDWASGPGGADSWEVEGRPPNGGFSLLATVAGSARSYTDSGLPDGISREYRVRGLARGGPSPFSAIVPASIPLNPPDGFTSVAPVSDRVDLAWNDRSVSETGYEIQRRIPPGSFQALVTLPPNAAMFADGTVNQTTAYAYRVRAVNAAGISAWSEERTVTTPVTLPAAPSNLRITFLAGNRVDLAWNDNATNETAFELQRSTAGGGFTILATPAANNVTFSDFQVQPTTAYQYRIRAVNLGGASGFSNVVPATTPEIPPGARLNLAAAAVSPTRVNLTWMLGTGLANSQTVERRIPPAGFAAVATISGTATGFMDSGLNESTMYEYRVKATNTGGDSPYSNVASVTTPLGIPAAPSGLIAGAISASQITISWQDNAANESGFEIERATGTGAFVPVATIAANSVAWPNIGLSPATQYFYRIRAINAAGKSGYSNTGGAMTLPLPPSPPTSANADGLGSTIGVYWIDTSANETGFQVDRRLDNGVWSTIGSTGPNAQMFEDTSPNCGSNHIYRVRALNEGGFSQYSQDTNAIFWDCSLLKAR